MIDHQVLGHQQVHAIWDLLNTKAYTFTVRSCFKSDCWAIEHTLCRSEEMPNHLVTYYVSKVDIYTLALPCDEALDHSGNFVVSF